MSRIEVTDLVPGESATSADVNSSLTSWNTGTAAGSIDETNVRMEGIDRRTMSAAEHVVYTTASGVNTRVIGPSGGVNNNSGSYAEVPGPLTTSDLTFDVNAQIIVHATLYMEGATNTTGTIVSLIMQSSSNGGGAWSDMVGTRQRFSTGNTASGLNGFTDAAVPYPGIATSASWSVYFTVAAGQTGMFRIAYQTSDLENINFLSGTIFTETFRL